MVQDKSKTIKISAALLIVGLAIPIYMFLGATIEGKRANAIANAKAPWAPEALASCIWRYEWSMRKKIATPLYEDWLKMYGGNDVQELCFPDRWAEIEEDGLEATDLKPPQINQAEPHKNTPYMLFQYALRMEDRRFRYKAQYYIELILDPDVFPKIDPELMKKIKKAHMRLKQ
jgi:hypothetical protein